MKTDSAGTRTSKGFLTKWVVNLKSIWSIMPTSSRNKAVFVGFMMLVGMGLELLVVGMAMPAITMLTVPSQMETFPVLADFFQWLGRPNPSVVMAWGMGGLVALFILKNAFRVVQLRQQAHFIYGVQEDISRYLFDAYLRSPYAFHLIKNSSELIRNVASEALVFASSVLDPVLVLFTEAFVLIAIVIFLLVVQPWITVVFFGMGGIGWLIHFFLNKKISDWGKQRQHHQGLMIKNLVQGLNGVKDVKLLGCEAEFLSRFCENNQFVIRLARRMQIIQQLPSLLIETVAMTVLCALTFVLINREDSLVATLPVLGMIFVAMKRLMPSIHRILNAVQSISFGWASVELMLKEQANPQYFGEDGPPDAINNEIHFDRDLVLDKVNYRYPNAEEDALTDVSLSISKGSSIGIIGRSGSGKSTLVNVILGLLQPKTGQLLLDGRPLLTDSIRAWQDEIGYVPQDIFLTDDSLRNNVAFGLSSDEIDDESVWKALRSAQLDEFARELPQELDTRMHERGVRLSGGQQQRVGIARALYHDPSVVVFDEATSSLDSTTEEGIIESIKLLMEVMEDKTIIIISHRMNSVQHCDEILKMENGKIVAVGSYSEVVTK